MADIIRPYNRAQNIYASGVADANAVNAKVAGIAAGLDVKCEVKVVPTDIFGNVLNAATVTINSEPAATVENFGNIAMVDQYTEVTYKVELEGYKTQEGVIPEVKNDLLIEVTLPFEDASAGA